MIPSFDIAGRVAVVTGASGGIGRAIASAFAEAGAKVVGVARQAEALEAWRAESTGEVAGIVADIGGPEAALDVGRRVAEPFGAPDILVNAAGLNTR